MLQPMLKPLLKPLLKPTLKWLGFRTLKIIMVTAILLIGILATPPKATATTFGPISRIYAFGDSYSDNRLSLEITTEAVDLEVPDSFILPADPELGLYDPQGRWSNGPTAVEILSENLQADLVDYAVGGAKSGDGNYHNWLTDFQNTGVFGQVEQFTTDVTTDRNQGVDPEALYFIFVSANDLFRYVNSHLPGTVQELASQVIRNIEQSIIYLADLGANQFMVVNSSDLKVLPGAIQFGQADVGGEFTDAFNRLLPVELAILGQDLGIEIGLYDHVAISDEIRSHPSQYGLTNLSDPCQPIHPVQPVCTAPDQYYFWDEYHPTTHVHHIIGEDMARFVQAHRVF